MYLISGLLFLRYYNLLPYIFTYYFEIRPYDFKAMLHFLNDQYYIDLRFQFEDKNPNTVPLEICP